MVGDVTSAIGVAQGHAGIKKLLFCCQKVFFCSFASTYCDHRWIVLKHEQVEQLRIITTPLLDYAPLDLALYLQGRLVCYFSEILNLQLAGCAHS